MLHSLRAVLTEDTEPVEAATVADVEQEDEQAEAGDAAEDAAEEGEMQPEEQPEEADAVRKR